MYTVNQPDTAIEDKVVTIEAWDRDIDEAGSLPPALNGVLEGVRTLQPRASIINDHIHNTRLGVAFQQDASDSLLYGCLISDNGWFGSDRPWQAGGHGPGVYMQNEVGYKRVHECILADNFSLNIQAYGTNNTAYLNNFDFEGNVSINSAGIVIGGFANPLRNLRFHHNITHTDRVEIGFQAQNEDADIQYNRFLKLSALTIQRFADLVFRNNVVYGTNRLLAYYEADSVQSVDWDYNTYYIDPDAPNKAAPFLLTHPDDTFEYLSFAAWQAATGFDAHSTLIIGKPADRVEVRANTHNAHRAHVIVENWSRADTVEVDLTALGLVGSHKLVNAINTAETQVISGSSVVVNMTAWSIATPANYPTPIWDTTFPAFGCFIVEVA